MKDLVYYALDVDIPIENNTTKRSFFTYIFIPIKHFWPVKSHMLTESIFFWLAQLSQLIDSCSNKLNCIESKSLLVSLFIYLNCTKSKSLLIGPPINFDRTKSKSFNDNCCRNNSIITKKVSNEEVEKDDLDDLNYYR